MGGTFRAFILGRLAVSSPSSRCKFWELQALQAIDVPNPCCLKPSRFVRDCVQNSNTFGIFVALIRRFSITSFHTTLERCSFGCRVLSCSSLLGHLAICCHC